MVHGKGLSILQQSIFNVIKLAQQVEPIPYEITQRVYIHEHIHVYSLRRTSTSENLHDCRQVLVMCKNCQAGGLRFLEMPLES